MTANQIAYQAAKETARANMAREQETERSNRAREAENERSAKAKEAETTRSNLADEDIRSSTLGETIRHNIMTEQETRRHNEHQEAAGYMNAGANVAKSLRLF